ncbi:low-density lipoprotein receptor-related protein 11 isoform X2 [Ambystoma mexicanum]|uniref:low-density lipoprotein receptor-related protein 11 isoform X2 n=1 Tax=Ambystoma mexicanum TaxID=8296 RepID=UPI0037E90D89
MLEGLIRLRPALLLLLLSYCWGPGHCRGSEDEGRVAPLSQLRSQVSSVEELLEEFRQQLQQQSEPLSPVDAHNQQGESLRTGVTQAVHYLQQEAPEDANLARRMHGEGRDSGDLGQMHPMHLGAESHLQVPGDEQGLRHLQQMQEEGRQQLGEDGCEGRFSTLQGYIIRTKDSLGAGATFLTAPGGVSSWHQCLGACCEEPRCSVAVVELSTSPSRQSAPALSCYLFDCIYKGGSVCTFSEHLGYSSFTSLRVNASAHRLGEPARSSKRKLPLTTEQEEIDEPPRSNAGQDVVLRLPTDWVHLDGRESVDDHGIIRYEWNLLHGDPSLDMKVPQPGTLQVSHLQEGAYAFQLTVTDTAGQRSSDNISVTVLPMEPRGVGCTGSCSRYQFTCDDGCCIDITLACDRVIQCSDASDEAFCQNFGPDRKTVTHAVNSNTEQKAMAFPKASHNALQIEKDQTNHVEQPSVLLDADKPKQLLTPSKTEKIDPFIPEHCLAPPDIGSCKGLISRWYFDVSSGTCMHFFYGGCKGNENNFLQETDCISECIDVHGVIPEKSVTKSPSNTHAVPDLGSSEKIVKEANKNDKIHSKDKADGGSHPAPETGTTGETQRKGRRQRDRIG